MSEWHTYKLKDITTKIGSGSTPTGGSGAYKAEGITLIRSQNVLDYKFTEDGLAFIDDDQAYSLRNVIVEVNDVLLNITGDSVARCCGAPANWLPARVNQHVAILRSDTDKLDHRFLKYSLLASKEELLILSEIGGTRNALTKGMLEDYEISIPTLPEQKAIASVLSSLDDKIDLLHRQNKTLEAMAETLFRQWFIEEAKEDWEEVKLGDLCEVITKGTTPKQFLESGVNFIKAESLTDTGSFIRSKFASVSTEIHDTFLKRSILQAGDLLFSIAGTIGRVAKVTADILPANTNQALAILRPKSHVNSDLIYCILKSSYFQELADGKVVHAVQPNLSLGEISNSCIRLPNQKVLQVFTEQVSAYFAKKSVNSSQIQTLENLRDTLLPKLMSGEVRVQYQTEEVA